MNLEPVFRSRPSGTWFRGGVWELKPGTTMIGPTDVPEVHLVTRGSAGFEYDPIADSPEAYLAFARLRDDVFTSSHPAYEARIANQWRALSKFVDRYGAPIMVSPLHRGGWGFPLEAAMDEALVLAIAVCCYQYLAESDQVASERYPESERHREKLKGYMRWVQSAGSPRLPRVGRAGYIQLEYSDFDTSEGFLKAQEWLQLAMNLYLLGVHPELDYGPQGLWLPRYRYDTLVNAMWLQLYQAVLRDSILRQCEGCEALFEAKRSDQVYHDAYCRSAVNARRTYWRKKRGPQA